MCTFLVGQERYRLGNVFDPGAEYSREEIAADDAFRNVHVDYVANCVDCEWRYLCSGHCPIARLAVEANEKAGFYVPEDAKRYTVVKLCKMVKTFYEMLVWDLARNKLPNVHVSDPDSELSDASRIAEAECGTRPRLQPS